MVVDKARVERQVLGQLRIPDRDLETLKAAPLKERTIVALDVERRLTGAALVMNHLLEKPAARALSPEDELENAWASLYHWKQELLGSFPDEARVRYAAGYGERVRACLASVMPKIEEQKE